MGKDEFVKEAKKNGLDQEYIDEILEMAKPFEDIGVPFEYEPYLTPIVE